MSRKWQLYLTDILDSTNEIGIYTNGIDRDDFIADSKTYDAVVRNLEIVGEAAKHIPLEFKAEMKEVPWLQISAMRNILAHAYFGIDEDILWDVIRNYIPALNASITRFLKTLEPEK